MGSWRQTEQGEVLPCFWVVLGKLCNLLEIQFPYLTNGNDKGNILCLMVEHKEILKYSARGLVHCKAQKISKEQIVGFI